MSMADRLQVLREKRRAIERAGILDKARLAEEWMDAATDLFAMLMAERGVPNG